MPAPLAEALRDRYVLQRELGRGGMATVFLAHDLKLDRLVALKVLRPELAHTLGPERFQREVEFAARLQHPHILTVHDCGEAAGQLWFTMPFVEGESLRERLSRQKQLSIEEALQIAKEVGEALEYAHQHGIIHRDIKPENILLTSDGSTLVADFGIAHALDGRDDRLTGTGLAIGTPAYMSPEQASGDRDLAGTTDVYSLGCVLYEMLAGEPPFTGPNSQAILSKRLGGVTPRLRAGRPAVPVAVEKAVARALSPMASERFPNAATFVRALVGGGLTAGSETTVRTPLVTRRVSRRALIIVVTAALGLLMGAVGRLLLLRSHRSSDIATGPIRLAVLPFKNLGLPGDEYFADGMTDEVRGRLAGLPNLAVVARSSSNQFKGSSIDPTRIGGKLKAEYLLTGTVRWDKSGWNSLRVTSQRRPSRPPTFSAPYDACSTSIPKGWATSCATADEYQFYGTAG